MNANFLPPTVPLRLDLRATGRTWGDDVLWELQLNGYTIWTVWGTTPQQAARKVGRRLGDLLENGALMLGYEEE